MKGEILLPPGGSVTVMVNSYRVHFGIIKYGFSKTRKFGVLIAEKGRHTHYVTLDYNVVAIL